MELCIHWPCSQLKFHWTQNQEKIVMAMAHFVHSLDDDDGDVDQNDDDINDDDGDCTNVMIVHWTLWCVSNPIFSAKSYWHSSQLLTRSCSDLPKRQMFMDAKFKIGEEHWKYSAWSWTLILHPWSWFLTHEITGNTWGPQVEDGKTWSISPFLILFLDEITGSTWEQQDLIHFADLDLYPRPQDHWKYLRTAITRNFSMNSSESRTAMWAALNNHN